MGYRDDKTAMKQRIEQLEGELSHAQRTIARLKGHADERTSDEMADMLTKPHFHHVREIDVELTDEAVERIADMLRRRLLNSQVSMVGNKLHCTFGPATFVVTRHEGGTELRIDSNEPIHKLLLAVGGIGFAVLGGPIVAGVAAGLAGLAGLTLPGWLGAAFAPVALTLGYFAMSALTKHTLSTRRTQLRGALEAAIELAEEHGRKPQLRIAPAAETEAEAEAEAETEAAAEAEAEAETAAAAAARR